MTLIDTNVVSELMRRAPEPAVVRWMNHQPSSLLHVAAYESESQPSPH